MCLYPRLIKNRKYTPNKKNGGQAPPVFDERTRYVPVGCQNCIECRKKKSREWQVRLTEDIKKNKNGKFITLTFSNEAIKEIYEEVQKEAQKNKCQVPQGYDMDNATATMAVRRWLERHRKKYGKTIRHWLVTELGHNGTENIHLHGIIWSDKPLDEIESIWGYGWMWKGKTVNGKITNYVNAQTINYIVKYVTKVDERHKTYKGIILTSPGIGGNYTERTDSKRNEYKEENTNEAYRLGNGQKTALPIYYRNKIYSDEEREKLWLEKLNKEERYVLGVKVDVSQGSEEYDKAVKYAREKNKKLGYGDNEKNYEQEQYERDRRILMQKTRIEKADKRSKKPPAAPTGGG